MKVPILLQDVGVVSSGVFCVCCSIIVGSLIMIVYLVIVVWSFVFRIITHVYGVVWLLWEFNMHECVPLDISV